ncbi:MAG TPA: IscS subfamily cysteine desulfurase [Steroidobacteraceae bacterium]|nr:IscS subfamily cysteine desulfurase [Steroidobacteraceae bacterium]
MSERLPIYLDYAATTPLDPRVAEAMIECLRPDGPYGNPSSMSHEYGRRARACVEKARAQVAGAIGARPETIVWTSGATESDNLAVLGVARFHAAKGKHLISARTEHKAVLDALKQAEREGFEVTYLKPGQDGIVTPEQLAEALRPDTILVSLMHVNNEIGVIQDIAAFGQMCRERDVLFHVDAAQSVGKVSIDVEAMNIDLLSMTAHKAYGPKGIGALYVRRKPPVGLRPIIFGGGQEGGLRSGTLATHQIVGMGLAFEIAKAEQAADCARIQTLRDRLWEGISGLGEVELNGHAHSRVTNVLNVSFAGIEGESLQFALRELAVSAGAACSSASDEASYVLRALGRSDALAQSSLRFSLGRFTTAEEIEIAIAALNREVTRLRSFAPR